MATATITNQELLDNEPIHPNLWDGSLDDWLLVASIGGWSLRLRNDLDDGIFHHSDCRCMIRRGEGNGWVDGFTDVQVLHEWRLEQVLRPQGRARFGFCQHSACKRVG